MSTTVPSSDILRALSALPLLECLPPQELESLAACAHLHAFAKGTPIFVEGQQATGFYVLLEGMIKLHHSTAEGRELVLHLIRPGASFGEAAVFQGGTFPASASAIQPSRAVWLPGDIFLERLRQNPELALRIIAALSLRLRMFTRKLESRHLREVPQRLAAYLLHRSALERGASGIRLDISREVLGNMLGTARETVSRTLSRLVEINALEVRGREVLLRNPALLRQVADGLVDINAP